MANSDLPQGARPHGAVLRMSPYTAASAIYPGDFVKLKSDGLVEVISTSDACVGVAASYASGSGVEVMLYDHPDQLFVCQSDDGTIDAATDMNLNYSVTVTAADTVYKISRHEIDGNTGVSDSNLPLKVLRIEPQVGNALGSAADCIVKINNHQLAGGTGTLGV